jgi:16S rRNA processing protein RimM
LSAVVRDLLAVGKVVKAFGIRGEVILQPMTGRPARFRELHEAYLVRSADAEAQTNAPARRVTIQRAVADARGVRATIDGITDRTAAEAIVGMYVMVDRGHQITVPRGTWFVHDIVGMAVEDDRGTHLGTVREVLHMPAHDVYVIAEEGREFMIPAVKEFILSVDVPAQRMRVKIIEGMLA